MPKCYMCGKESFGKCLFNNGSDNLTDEFYLCKECYYNFIKVFKISKETIDNAKNYSSKIMNSKDAELGTKLKKFIDEDNGAN